MLKQKKMTKEIESVIKNDAWIISQAQNGMITPFVSELVRQIQVPGGYKLNLPERPVISYGLSSYGIDLRLSRNDFRMFRRIPGTVVSPKEFNPASLERAQLCADDNGEFFVLPANSYGLGVTVECVDMPLNVTGLLLNKSTYVRCGVLLPTTVIEAGWKGHITLEFSNSSAADVKLFAEEGIAQLLFFEGEPCNISYADRKGKYQDQQEAVTLAKV